MFIANIIMHVMEVVHMQIPTENVFLWAWGWGTMTTVIVARTLLITHLCPTACPHPFNQPISIPSPVSWRMQGSTYKSVGRLRWRVKARWPLTSCWGTCWCQKIASWEERLEEPVFTRMTFMASATKVKNKRKGVFFEKVSVTRIAWWQLSFCLTLVIVYRKWYI